MPQAAFFFPGMDAKSRRTVSRAFPPALALTSEFDPGNWYGNWWWGISPSALRAMVEVNPGLEVVEELRAPFDTVLIARRT